MTLITRVSRLFRADLHAVLDRVEEPDLVLQQAVREMEEDLARDHRLIEALRAQVQQVDARDCEIERSQSGIGNELDICFEAGNDDLARTLIRRKLEGKGYRTLLSGKRERLEKQLARLDRRVSEHEMQLDAMRQKAELLAPREPDACGLEVWETPRVAVTSEDVEVALLREQQRRKQS